MVRQMNSLVEYYPNHIVAVVIVIVVVNFRYIQEMREQRIIQPLMLATILIKTVIITLETVFLQNCH